MGPGSDPGQLTTRADGGMMAVPFMEAKSTAVQSFHLAIMLLYNDRIRQ